MDPATGRTLVDPPYDAVIRECVGCEVIDEKARDPEAKRPGRSVVLAPYKEPVEED